MAVVSSFGAVQQLGASAPSWVTSSGVSFYGSNQTLAKIYATQPNVRTVVDFLARNIAQLGLGVYRRVSDTDRVRIHDHPLWTWIAHPNPSTTRYRLIETLMQDLGIYFNAFWLKVRVSNPAALGLVRLSPEHMRVEGALLPTAYIWIANGQEQRFAPSEIVHFGGFDPANPLVGLSPLETLRRVLAEEHAAGEYRQAFWQNAARTGGVIEQDPTGPTYTPDQILLFRNQWQDAHAGGANSGKTAVLPKGMKWNAAGSFSAQESEFLGARKLTREEVAAAYHIPLPMVGILDHATFSNIKEQHKNLYQDCLGPWLVMIEEELERQLLVECVDQDNIYLEFNIAEKLKGSFEEQAASLHTLVGAPVMTRNEGRARLNLPKVLDPTADDLILPLNMGGAHGAPVYTNTPTDSTTDPPSATSPTATVWATTVQAFWARQQQRIEKMPAAARAQGFDVTRWNRELAADLAQLTTAHAATQIAEQINIETLSRLDAQQLAFGADRDDHWPGAL